MQNNIFPQIATNFKDKIYDFKSKEVIDQIREVKVDTAEKVNKKAKYGTFFQDTNEEAEKSVDDEDASLELKEKIEAYLKSDDEFFKNPKIERYDKMAKYYQEIKTTMAVPEEISDDEDNECLINNKEYDENLSKEHSR